MRRCIVVLALLALPTPALAQPSEALSFGTGVAAPLSPGWWSDIYRVGVSFNATMDVPVSENVSIQPRVFYAHLRLDHGGYFDALGVDGNGVTLSGGSAAIIYGAMNGRIGLPESRPVAPYVFFGAGLFRGSGRALQIYDGNDWSTVEAAEPDVGLGIDFGVGTTVAITSEVAARGEVQYLAGFLEDDTFAVAPITFGVTFQL